MKTSQSILVGLALLSGAPGAGAQVPQLLNYQGRVQVGTTDFNGTGQFKFALVNADGTATYWSNDGTPAGQPASSVTLPVARGLYSVQLGDATLTNMQAVPPDVFSKGDAHLRVWFNDGVNGFQQFAPDQRIAAVGYAMMAGNVSEGAITASGLAPSAAAGNLASSGQSGVASGGMVLSATANNPNLVNAGYLKMGVLQGSDAWQRRYNGTPPTGRSGHVAVWSGTEMLVWGGYYFDGNDRFPSTGGRYHLANDSWAPMATVDAPAGRIKPVAVWTGSEMFVWGGADGSGGVNTGGRYNPTANTWTGLPTNNAPSARQGHTAVWTGTEMIVWGGTANGAAGVVNTGARYNPAATKWDNLATAGAPSARFGHVAIWTGNEMIVWGGHSAAGFEPNLGRYNPTANTWTTLNPAGAPAGRRNGTAVWTGNQMIVWGGDNTAANYVTDAGCFNPTANTWTAVNMVGTPSGRNGHTAVWTGNEMVVYGGAPGVPGADGARYQPAGNFWTAFNDSSGLTSRRDHTAVWTGSEMLVWGGLGGTTYLNETWSYLPARTLFVYQRP